eukprot:1462850-Amphidinium_carterae.1
MSAYTCQICLSASTAASVLKMHWKSSPRRTTATPSPRIRHSGDGGGQTVAAIMNLLSDEPTDRSCASNTTRNVLQYVRLAVSSFNT